MKTQNATNGRRTLMMGALLLLIARPAPAGSGAWDTAYAPAVTGGAVNAMALQPDGRLLIGGAFTAVNNSSARARLARLSADGSLDPTFFDTGSGVSGTIWSLAVQSDGRIVIGGDFMFVNGTARTRVARLNTNGIVDASFVTASGINGSVLAVAVQTNNKVVVGGKFSGGTFPSWIARLNADGSPDPTFNPVLNGEVNAIAIQKNGKIVIGGAFNFVNGTNQSEIARLNIDGTLDSTFLIGEGASTRVRCLQIQGDGKILVGGDFTSFDFMARGHVARLHTNGVLDAGFTSSPGANSAVRAMAVQPDGRIMIAGDFSTYAAVNLSRVARLEADGTRDPSFSTFGINNLVQAMAVQGDDGILIGGTFTTINHTNRSYLGRLYGDLYPPEFATQPVSRATNAGATVVFTASLNNPTNPTNLTPASFQWRKEGTNLAGATGMSCSLTNVQPLNAGNYSLFVSNAAGVNTSSNAVLQVGIAPAITSQPVSLIVTQGQNATFGVTATGTPLSYFWRKGGAIIPGATNAAYTITNAVAGSAGSYTCQISNFLSSVTSQAATATVYFPPVITMQPISQDVGAGSNFTVSVTATGNPVPGYRWSKDGSAILGATASTYTVTGAQPSAAGDYIVVLTNSVGAVTSSVAQINILYYAPTITNPGFTGDQFGFGINGTEGIGFVVEASTNFTSWQVITTNTFGPGRFLFLDPASSTNPMSFYRVGSP